LKYKKKKSKDIKLTEEDIDKVIDKLFDDVMHFNFKEKIFGDKNNE